MEKIKGSEFYKVDFPDVMIISSMSQGRFSTNLHENLSLVLQWEGKFPDSAIDYVKSVTHSANDYMYVMVCFENGKGVSVMVMFDHKF